jgi:hypothetical protein
VKKGLNIPLDFEIDKLTNSIENAISGEVFDTDVLPVTVKDKKQIRKSDWQFDWHKELSKADREIYKLITQGNPEIIHGLISFTDNYDHIFMHLIESVKFNKGANKLYKGVPANLVAFACKSAFEKGYRGVVSFVAKSQLIEHYKASLGAKILTSNKMYIDTKEAFAIVKQYFKNFEL